MKSLTFASAAAALLALLSAMICGLWMRVNGIYGADSIGFHMACGSAAVVFSFSTAVFSGIALFHDRKRRGAR